MQTNITQVKISKQCWRAKNMPIPTLAERAGMFVYTQS